MRALNRVYLELILPAVEPRNFSGVASRFRKYQTLESLPLAENLARQWKSLQNLLRYSYENTSFYRARFDEAGIRPESIQSPADFQKLPVLTRADIAFHLDKLQSREFGRQSLHQAATGGTTDTPVAILRDPSSVLEKAAIQLRFNAWV